MFTAEATTVQPMQHAKSICHEGGQLATFCRLFPKPSAHVRAATRCLTWQEVMESWITFGLRRIEMGSEGKESIGTQGRNFNAVRGVAAFVKRLHRLHLVSQYGDVSFYTSWTCARTGWGHIVLRAGRPFMKQRFGTCFGMQRRAEFAVANFFSHRQIKHAAENRMFPLNTPDC